MRPARVLRSNSYRPNLSRFELINGADFHFIRSTLAPLFEALADANYQLPGVPPPIAQAVAHYRLR